MRFKLFFRLWLWLRRGAWENARWQLLLEEHSVVAAAEGAANIDECVGAYSGYYYYYMVATAESAASIDECVRAYSGYYYYMVATAESAANTVKCARTVQWLLLLHGGDGRKCCQHR